MHILGLVGLAISYALSITGLLSGVVKWAFTETEREMIAVERVKQYIDHVEPEVTSSSTDPPYAWPFQGVVTFSNATLKYRFVLRYHHNLLHIVFVEWKSH